MKKKYHSNELNSRHSGFYGTNVMDILKTVFGYDNFRPLQREIIEHILAKKDTLVVLPTGGGKSLCFQLPALVFDGLTIVVSPLISLMKDQVDQLQEMGISAVCLNSSLTADQYRHHVSLIRQNRVKLLYIAPESLVRPQILNMLETVSVECLAIDEAHCISAWGHDFRPEYRHLAQIRPRFPDAVCAAFTATATPAVQKDIQASLVFSTDAGFKAFIGSFDRKNLLIRVMFKEAALRQTLDFLNTHQQDSGIIYCLSRNRWKPCPPNWRIEAFPCGHIMRASRMLTGTGSRPNSSETMSGSWWPPSPLAWVLTSPMSGSCSIMTCPKVWKTITRRSAGPDGTDWKRNACSCFPMPTFPG